MSNFRNQILCGDCLEVMASMPESYVSSIVTDPPYGLRFMGKGWDSVVPGVEVWREALRVTKPGGYLLAFGGTRTWHRLAVAIEDAGWNLVDCLVWLYGSGMPKSFNLRRVEILRDFRDYGTALKPAFEPLLLAMKPLDGTYANNALVWGQAGMNIDACRIGVDPGEVVERSGMRVKTSSHVGYQRPGNSMYTNVDKERGGPANALGRWPANVLFSHNPDCEEGECVEGCAVRQLDEQSGTLKTGDWPTVRNASKFKSCYGQFNGEQEVSGRGANVGGASRFFYCAKASSRERGKGNNHPTVKPLKLMSYLVRLVTPPSGGLILDPFAGSGSTLLACDEVGVDYVGIEKEQAYCDIIESRLLEQRFLKAIA